MNIKILVATHKPYIMPDDGVYLPIHVGAEGKQSIGFQGDNSGDNISIDNPRFCELTALYWAWKNLDADYIGLAHYRRHFTSTPWIKRFGKKKFHMIAGKQELKDALGKFDLILPNKRKYHIESIYTHYIHLPYTYEKDIKVLGKVIKELYPEYLDAYKVVMNRNWAHMFNMFVMKKEYFDKYCEWMFTVLFEVDRRIDISGYTPMETRAVAFLGEFMLDIWNEKNKIPYKEMDVMFMEKQNWVVKVCKFIIRKITLSKK